LVDAPAVSRVTLTEKQFAVLGKRKPRAKGAHRIKKRKEDLPENQLEKQCLDFLRIRGWIVDRQQSGLFRAPWGGYVRVGEKGCFDWIALRPFRLLTKPEDKAMTLSDVLYLELKAPGKKPNVHQLAWARRRRVAGFLCICFAEFSDFTNWYRGRFGE
jgi:hypothetical protein